MEEVLKEVLIGVGGFLAGIGVWFPFKFYINKAVAKKRETSAILRELAQSEQEHMQEKNPVWVQPPASTGPYTTPYTTPYAPTNVWSLGGPPQNYQVDDGTSGSSSTA